ncbi:hypothetical protein GCM10023080_049890 [Streptomyces pseudoechinosporeus]
MPGTSRPRTGRVRVLIVVDDPTLTEVLSVAVTEAGRRACPASDGRSAPRAGAEHGRAPMIHTGPGPGYAIRPAEEGR